MTPPPAAASASSLTGARLLIALTVLTLLAGCATKPGSQTALLRHWTQLGPDGAISLRAIVAATDECPTAIIDGQARPLQPRAKAATAGATNDNPAFQPDFPVTACELTLPATASQASIDEQALALPRQAPRHIVVVGDSGCRIKVPASGQTPPIQDCANASDWPWQQIAAAAAATRPDLVIHVGDYHYREYCANEELCAPLREQGVLIGYGWDAWNADFFAPAAPLLAAAPWVMVRGNHENCDRAGAGWMRFLSPVPYQICPDQRYGSASGSDLANNHTADAYRVDVDEQLTLVVADNAGNKDYLPATSSADDVPLFTRQLAVLQTIPPARQVWLLAHRPLWYDSLAARSQPNALQLALRNKLPANVQMIVAGHQHNFATLNFAASADPLYHPAGRPAQLIVGIGGTELDAFNSSSPFYQGRNGADSTERAQPGSRLYDAVAASSGIVLNRYGFLLLERDDEGQGWSGSLRDVNGVTISRCRLTGERKAMVCSIPAH